MVVMVPVAVVDEIVVLVELNVDAVVAVAASVDGLAVTHCVPVEPAVAGVGAIAATADTSSVRFAGRLQAVLVRVGGFPRLVELDSESAIQTC